MSRDVYVLAEPGDEFGEWFASHVGLINSIPEKVVCPKCNTDLTEHYDPDTVLVGALSGFADWYVIFSTCCGAVIAAYDAPTGVVYETCACGRPNAHATCAYGRKMRRLDA